jgi:hypothetical protein
MVHASSVGLPRINDDDARVVRLLRLKAGARTLQMLRAAKGDDHAYVDVPSREAVTIGEAVRVEIGFGALSDEVEIDGLVHAVEPGIGAGAPTVVIRVDDDHRSRVRFAAAVLGGERTAASRTHRRIPTDLECRWTQGTFEHQSRIIDLSHGGAFIRSQFCPKIGATVVVQLPDLGGRPLRLDAVVTWVRATGPQAGFGVNFKLRDRNLAQQLHRMVREQERSAAVR